MSAYSTYTDQELTALLKSGDEYAFTEVYNRYWRVLYALAYNRLRDTQSAEDIVHDVLVSIWKNRATAEVEHLNAYLARATKYMVFHVIKRAQKFSHDEHAMDNAELVIDQEDIEDRLHYKRLLEMVNTEVEMLPEKCRLVFKYSREEQLSVKEIAEKMNVSTSTVENQMNKALNILRKNVKNIHLILF
ncbi:RNA polymerase sigma-70 factor [Pedobacter heparinus]|uniref:RNA polymerase sigma-70 factor n=1 Tax=Pedobacter heparinus (strain ATCC 13125 / DSM 2366 / CIP 104194 / JCM 7457 / NBRC 12017 / NCIMB 9290 / NRRL B-14731 / HIM 762-3) TaxID=485917 RepID=C6XVE1_PEDHD|nr:RNA polymerase sigma-70 factor [Pedobacter heparinus]ACU04007.1 RNA polymerase sigma-70 factor [Pedobacter heparinus DSM 2366]